MPNKIIEKITEPSKIYESSTFLLKIKTIRYLTYDEVKENTYTQTKVYTYAQLKGD